MTAANYTACYKFTEAFEGGRSDNPADPGGRTMCGVTQRTYEDWRRRHGSPPRNVFESTSAERAAIFCEEFWDSVHGDTLPAGVDLAVFDLAVNSGPGTAREILARCGGPKVPARKLIQDICTHRLVILHGLRNWRVFGRGWGRRVAACEATALRMCTVDPHTALTVARDDAINKRETIGFVAAIALGSGIALTPVAPDGLSMVAVAAGSAVIAGAAALASWRHGQRVDAFNKELSA